MRIKQIFLGLCFSLVGGAVSAQIPELVGQLIDRPSLYTDQAVLEIIPQIDPLYRQYIFPAFHEMSAMSHRLRTMPEIAKWRGKVPTRLAPEVEGKGPYGWRYLSPFLYIYLMPEMWPSFYRESEPPKPEITRQIDWTNAEDVARTFDQFADAEAARQAFVERALKDVPGGLSEQDMRTVHQVLSDLIDVSETREGKAVFAHVVVALDSDDIYPTMARPCASLVARLHTIGMEHFLTPVLQKAGVSEQDFVDKCERVTRAYRVANSSPEMAMYIIGIRRKLKAEPSAQKAPIWQALVDMFSVSMADVQAVQPYQAQWKELFNRQRPLLLGTPFMLDF
ncbi:MAG: hypothetical protein ILP11_01820 [Alphaproteobacteria bacterium]|nr:hypothetical protein [Alphaproteobacteria bacterium]